jgi:hypothetical protein
VVVTVGLTVCVPPVADKGYEVPSLPVITTTVALVALTVNVEEVPDVIAGGVAVTVTDGAGLEVTVTVAAAVTVPPVPVAVAVYVVVAIGLTAWVPPVCERT